MEWHIWITIWIIFCIIYSRLFEYSLKKHETLTNNPSIKTYIDKIKHRIAFEIKTEYYFELLTPETMKLLGKTETKITKGKIVKISAFRN